VVPREVKILTYHTAAGDLPGFGPGLFDMSGYKHSRDVLRQVRHFGRDRSLRRLSESTPRTTLIHMPFDLSPTQSLARSLDGVNQGLTSCIARMQVLAGKKWGKSQRPPFFMVTK